jgi:hypothetical protein
VPIDVKWFRSNIRHGSRLALFALVVQLVLSFGHFHAFAAHAAPVIQSGQAVSYVDGLPAADGVSGSAQRQPASHHDPDQQPSDACAICAVIALANAMLFAAPPLLLLPIADAELLHQATDTEFVDLNSAAAAFQPRGPPAS